MKVKKKKLNQLANLLEVQLPAHCHVGIFSLTGGGKSFLAHRLAITQKRDIIYMMNVGDSNDFINAQTWDIENIAENDQMVHIMNNEEYHPIIISDSGKNYEENLEYIWQFLLDNNFSAIILMDEIQKYQQIAERYTNEGRKHNITVIYTSIRPEAIKNVTITSNTLIIILFAISEKMEQGLKKNYGIMFPVKVDVYGDKFSPVLNWINDTGDGLTPIYYYHGVIYNHKRWIFIDKDYHVVDSL